jgi:hypothetical protein
VNTTLTIEVVSCYDADYDYVELTYTWYKNGYIIVDVTGATLVPGLFNKGDIIYCVVTPYDGYEYGLAQTTNEVIICNAPPWISPVIPDQTVMEGTVRWVNLTGHIHDLDNLIAELIISVDTLNIIVHNINHTLELRYGLDAGSEYVRITVSDGIDSTYQDIYIRVVLVQDLAVSDEDLRFMPKGAVETGQSIKIMATIHNIGRTTVSSLIVQFYEGDPARNGVIIGTQLITDLLPYESKVATITWTATSVGEHKIYVVIDPDNVVEEFNETNNIAWKSIEVIKAPEVPKMPVKDWEREGRIFGMPLPNLILLAIIFTVIAVVAIAVLVRYKRARELARRRLLPPLKALKARVEVRRRR